MAKWTTKQIKILKEKYKTKPAREIGLNINKSREAIIGMARRLKIRKVERWNKEQIELLKKDFPLYSSIYLSKKIGKTDSAIRKQAERLGLKKYEGYRNRERIEEITKRLYTQPNSFSSFICGFTAGEGSFVKSNKNQLKFKFTIALADDDEKILEEIKEFFGTGTIRKYLPRKKNWKGSVVYEVGYVPALIKIIIPFFDKYGFFSARKQKQYLIWKQELLKYVSIEKECS